MPTSVQEVRYSSYALIWRRKHIPELHRTLGYQKSKTPQLTVPKQ